MYLLNFRRQCFEVEPIRGMHRIPRNFRSVQIVASAVMGNQSGTIYLVGGIRDNAVLRLTYRIDSNL